MCHARALPCRHSQETNHLTIRAYYTTCELFATFGCWEQLAEQIRQKMLVAAGALHSESHMHTPS
uniref:Uncharacterized protein n=1 Tax=Arundo donax TaxID=35708 RepID=A0A0A9C4U2_ARUDO